MNKLLWVFVIFDFCLLLLVLSSIHRIINLPYDRRHLLIYGSILVLLVAITGSLLLKEKFLLSAVLLAGIPTVTIGGIWLFVVIAYLIK